MTFSGVGNEGNHLRHMTAEQEDLFDRRERQLPRTRSDSAMTAEQWHRVYGQSCRFEGCEGLDVRACLCRKTFCRVHRDPDSHACTHDFTRKVVRRLSRQLSEGSIETRLPGSDKCPSPRSPRTERSHPSSPLVTPRTSDRGDSGKG